MSDFDNNNNTFENNNLSTISNDTAPVANEQGSDDPIMSANIEFLNKLEETYPEAFIVSESPEEGKTLTISPVFSALTKPRPNEYPQEMLVKMEKMASTVRGHNSDTNTPIKSEDEVFDMFALKGSVNEPAVKIQFSRNGIKYTLSNKEEKLIPKGLMGLGDNDQLKLKTLVELSQFIGHFEKENNEKLEFIETGDLNNNKRKKSILLQRMILPYSLLCKFLTSMYILRSSI